MPDVDTTPIEPMLALLRDHATDGTWLKCVFSHPDPAVAASPGSNWEKLTAEPVQLARGTAVKLVSTVRGRQTTLTALPEQWPARLTAILARNPRHINLLARDRDWHARLSKSGRWLVSKGKPSQEPVLPAGELPGHDRGHTYPLPGDDPAVQRLFTETGLFGLSGRLRGEAADKYRQVQHYLELLRPLGVWSAERPNKRPLRVVDAGCGKAYLSLALYLFAERQAVPIELVAVDSNPSVIESVARSADRLGYDNVDVRAQSIAEFVASSKGETDLLVSLHACDTATDEAIAAGIRMGARAIVLAPCCQHELVAQMEAQAKAGSAPGGEAFEAVAEHGLLLHRQADIVTDALRAAALEMFGYRADVLEFVSPESTARNLMIRAELRTEGPGREQAMAKAREAYRSLAAAWSVRPAMERLLGELWPFRDE
jgi:SAM-dependent methyltransferase